MVKIPKFEVIGWVRTTDADGTPREICKVFYRYNGEEDTAYLWKKDSPKRKDAARAIKKDIKENFKDELERANAEINYWQNVGDLKHIEKVS